MQRANVSDLEKLFSKAFRQGGCLIWARKIDRHGYGHTVVNRKHLLAHRVAYTLAIGEIPAGLTIDHLCRNTRCIEPSHLEAVTIQENLARVPLRPACRSGHLFDEANTYLHEGTRHCRACNRQAVRRAKERRSAAA